MILVFSFYFVLCRCYCSAFMTSKWLIYNCLMVIVNTNGWINSGQVKLLDITIFFFIKVVLVSDFYPSLIERKDSPESFNNR